MRVIFHLGLAGVLWVLAGMGVASAADKSDSGICPAHGVNMERVNLKVVYGMPSEREFEEMRVGRELFPHGRDYVLAGCVVKNVKTKKGWLCPRCVKAREAWLASRAEGGSPAGASGEADARSQRAQAALEEFFALLDARDVDGALACLDRSMAPDENSRSAWRSQFFSIRAIHVMDVEPVGVAAWSETRQVFRVTLEAYVRDAPDAPIPHFGWRDNPNIRWVCMQCGEGGQWRVASMASGP